MADILRLSDIRHRYNGRIVLDIPVLALERGTITGLTGPNGSGKSTLLRIMALAEKSAAGTICFAGRPVRPHAGVTRRRITLLPQQTYLLRRKVFDNVAFGLKIRGRKRDLGVSVGEALGMVGLPPSFAGRQWHELSGGEAQRVALAARLALRPELFLLDEPTASVDLESARAISRAVLLAREKWGTTLVISSHRRSWLDALCDEIINLFNGRLLDCSFDNVLLGPWEKWSDTDYCTRLADGQRIHVPVPPQPDSTAVIDPHALSLAEDKVGGVQKTLRGTVTAITYDRQHQTPRLHVVCGDHPFVLTLPDRDRLPAGCLPGRSVTLVYRPEAIRWLEQGRKTAAEA